MARRGRRAGQVLSTGSNLVWRVWLFVGSPVVRRDANFNSKVLPDIDIPSNFHLLYRVKLVRGHNNQLHLVNPDSKLN